MNRFCFALLLFAAVPACSTALSDEPLGGETHWLSSCGRDGDCSVGLSCECGLCTQPCGAGDDDACAPLGDGAICLESQATPYDNLCKSPKQSFCGTESLLDAGPMQEPCSSNEARYEGECVDCNAASRETQSRLQALAADFAQCEEDSDCVVAEPAVLCGGACAPVASAQLADYQTEADALGSDLCSDEDIWRGPCQLSRIGCEGEQVECAGGSCALVDPARCSLGGARFDAEQACFLEAETIEVVSCDAAGGDDALTHAVDPAGQCWLLPTTTLPSGFLAVQAEAEACAATHDTCNGTCPIVGVALDEARGCFSDGSVLGRFPADTCGSGPIVLYTTARAPDGRCYWFPGGGYPEGFTDVTGQDPECDAQVMPPCD